MDKSVQKTLGLLAVLAMTVTAFMSLTNPQLNAPRLLQAT